MRKTMGAKKRVGVFKVRARKKNDKGSQVAR